MVCGTAVCGLRLQCECLPGHSKVRDTALLGNGAVQVTHGRIGLRPLDICWPDVVDTGTEIERTCGKCYAARSYLKPLTPEVLDLGERGKPHARPQSLFLDSREVSRPECALLLDQANGAASRRVVLAADRIHGTGCERLSASSPANSEVRGTRGRVPKQPAISMAAPSNPRGTANNPNRVRR